MNVTKKHFNPYIDIKSKLNNLEMFFFLLKIIVKFSRVRTKLADFKYAIDVTTDITQVYDVTIRHIVSM